MAEKGATGKLSKLDNDQELRLLVVITAIILIVALFSFLIIPRGSELQKCGSVVLTGNKEQCYYTLALSSKNSTLCGSLYAIDAAACYVAIAEESDNESLCYKVGNANITASCVNSVANATGSYKACYGLNGSYRDACVGIVALKENNATLCSQISDGENGTICTSTVQFNNAIRLKNASYCSLVNTSYNSNITSAVLAKVNIYNYTKAYVNISSYVTLFGFLGAAQISSGDFCYLAFASQYDNSSACSKISNATVEQSCNSVTQPQAKPGSANAINYTALLADCVQPGLNQTPEEAQGCTSLISISEAVNTKNASICSTLPANASYECYVTMAEQYANLTYCNYITNISVHTACLDDIYYNESIANNATIQSIV